jgi:hypothetical protein
LPKNRTKNNFNNNKKMPKIQSTVDEDYEARTQRVTEMMDRPLKDKGSIAKRCHLCHGVGHLKKVCPNKQQQKPEKCKTCGCRWNNTHECKTRPQPEPRSERRRSAEPKVTVGNRGKIAMCGNCEENPSRFQIFDRVQQQKFELCFQCFNNPDCNIEDIPLEEDADVID